MTGATSAPDEIGMYLGAVRAALSDLPADERDDLLVEVEASLADAAAEGEAPVAARLGPPEEFAAELRAAAGLHSQEDRPTSAGPDFRERLRRLSAHPRLAQISSLARELAPVWWVVRGYAAVGMLAVFLGTPWADRYAFVPRFEDSPWLGLALIGVGIGASVAIGLTMRRRGIRSHIATLVNIALVAALWGVVVEVDNATLGVVAPSCLHRRNRFRTGSHTKAVPSTTSIRTGATAASSMTCSSTTRPALR